MSMPTSSTKKCIHQRYTDHRDHRDHRHRHLHLRRHHKYSLQRIKVILKVCCNNKDNQNQPNLNNFIQIDQIKNQLTLSDATSLPTHNQNQKTSSKLFTFDSIVTSNHNLVSKLHK